MNFLRLVFLLLLLIFLRLKGVLDALANFACASGTNAWTAQDHTTYTLQLGYPNALTLLLSIYLDHIFFPLLLPSHFLTEVYALSSDNSEAGVVFCEMQSVERKLSTISWSRIQSMLFPGENGYNVETGGLLEQIRSPSMNMDAIRDYHRRFYRPDNALLFVCGANIDCEQLLAGLNDVDQRLSLHVASLPEKLGRPFLSTPLQPMVPHESLVEFPSETEDFGRVIIGYRLGPFSKHRVTVTELSLLGDYLSEGIASPLYVALVDQPEPFCRSVDFSFLHYAELAFTIILSGVPAARLQQAKERVFQVLQNFFQAGIIDSDRMHSIIQSALREDYSSIETEPAETLQDNLALAFLYFDLQKDLLDVLWGDRILLQNLLDSRVSDSEFWMKLLKEHVLDAPHVDLLCKPSMSMHEALAKEDAARAERRLQELGLAAIKEAGEALETAIEKSSEGCPPDILEPYIEKVRGSVDLDAFHQLETFRLRAPVYEKGPAAWLNAHLHPLGTLPFACFEADHYSGTQFVDLSVSLNLMDCLNEAELLHLELIAEMMFAAPLTDMPDHVAVGNAMRRDLLSESAGVGLQGSNHFAPGSWPTVLSLFVRAICYEKAVTWIRRSLFDSVFSADRIRVAYNALKSRMDDANRSPSKWIRSLTAGALFKKGSVPILLTLESQKVFLKQFGKMLLQDPVKAENAVAGVMQKIRTCPPLVHVVGDFRRVMHPARPWEKWFSDGVVANPLEGADCMNGPPPPTSYFLSGKSFSKNRLIVKRLRIEECHLAMYWPGPTFAANKSDLPAAMVLCDWLSRMDSELWLSVRGPGLAYGVYLSMDSEKGWMKLSISEASSVADLKEAVRASQEVLASMESDIDELALEVGKSVALAGVLSSLQTHQSVAESRYRGIFRGYSSQWLLKKIQKVTVEQMISVYRRFILERISKALTVVVIPKEEEDFALE